MLAVSGASGKLGGLVLRHLLDRVDASRVLALTRTPDRVKGVRARHADFTAPGDLARALDGVERLLVISLDAWTGRVPAHTAAIEAAAEAGVGHLVYTSVTRAGDPGNPVGVVADHRDTERVLAGSGVPFTALRFNFWPEILLDMGLAQRAVATGELPTTAGKGRVGYVTRDDSAAVASAVLAEGGSTGEYLDVTGPEAVTAAGLAAALSEATGRPVRHVPLDPAEATARLAAQGVPETLAAAWAGAGAAHRAGWMDVVTGAVPRLTGRPATSLTAYLTGRRADLL
ncbi:NAD(P)H-binding protein [Actinomadura parmotrematis]|uniref:NAD(P)H-binding protein n=1 Tax=Actinomadura parmotrematis TaxID=2864039 RepID=A0ABS7G4G0_9ACTN|nr:NAD(P)H-binding protein [Actinomadura parmotrematis]MBW8487592.1 NAD(P)H-binding protein [Actinomadura parmotrematis]